MTARSKPQLLALFALCALPGLAVAANGADAWLERMNRALHELSYDGRFVYQHGQTLEAMYLSHRVEAGQELERLVSLTGVPREVIRDDDAVTCIVSGRDTPHVDKRPAGRRLAPIQAIQPERLADHYRFNLGDQERVAGRKAQAISIIPTDHLRYGYLLLLDEEHALPLAAATLDTQGRRISQLLFTELHVGEPAEAPPYQIDDATDVTRMVRPRRIPDQDLQPRWHFHGLPGGFEQTRYRRRLMGKDDHEVEHFIFSDGLATVSVYIEEDRETSHGAEVSRLGAVTALRRTMPGYQVTAVGEVPEPTLQMFLDGIRADTAAP